MTTVHEVCHRAIPVELRRFRKFVLWRTEKRRGKAAKVPYDAKTGLRASTCDPQSWVGFHQAVRALKASRGCYDGLGFVFTMQDPFVGIDLDGALDEHGRAKGWARRIVDCLATYTEVSPGGRGLKLLVRGRKPGERCAKRPYHDGAVEVYDQGRYFALTGKRLPSTPSRIEDRGPQLGVVYRTVFGSNRDLTRPQAIVGFHRTAGVSDKDIIRTALASRIGAKFRNLWLNGRLAAYDGDHSAADLALCNYLAFYCGVDQIRIDALFRRSRLYRRKWDERHAADNRTYGEMTIARALRGRKRFYAWKR